MAEENVERLRREAFERLRREAFARRVRGRQGILRIARELCEMGNPLGEELSRAMWDMEAALEELALLEAAQRALRVSKQVELAGAKLTIEFP